MLNEPSQGPAPTPFPFRRTEVTHLDISGGTWHNVEGNSFNNCNIFVARDGQILQALSLSPTQPCSTTKRSICPPIASDSRTGTKAPQDRELSSASTPRSPSASLPSPEFLIAMSKLEEINRLITPHTGAIGIFKGVEPCLRDLTALVGFASTAYTACGSGTILGNIVRVVIDTRMKHCNCVLSQLLEQITLLPHRSFPRARYAYSVVHEWWTGNEPGEIRRIRLSMSEAVTAIGEWLRCLHSFWWASSQLLTMNSTFSMENLREFLESGPISMLREIVVEEITFLEPLQGEHRSIPIQFVETFQDVHMAIGMACRGTAASRFIEQRQYQLDESTTDATVSEENILQRMEQCRVFEITITFSRLEVLANVCPRCGRSHDGGDQRGGSGWLRCHHCGTKFNAYASTPVKAKIEEENIEINETFDGSWNGHPDRPNSSYEDGEAGKMKNDILQVFDSVIEGSNIQQAIEDCDDNEIDSHDQFRMSDAELAKLFRRIKFEVQPELGVPDHSAVEHLGDIGMDNHSKNHLANSDSIKPKPFVLLLGVTGAGRSTFVNHCIPGAHAPTSHGLISHTKGVEAYSSTIPGPGFVLVDTPGLDDPNSTPDSTILRMIIKWVEKSYPFGFDATQCGIIFLQDEDASYGRINGTIGLLQKAFETWDGGAVHLVNTKGYPTTISYVYNGTITGERSATRFCQDMVKTSIAANLSVRELLEELKKVHKVVSPIERGEKKQSRWSKLQQ